MAVVGSTSLRDSVVMELPQQCNFFGRQRVNTYTTKYIIIEEVRRRKRTPQKGVRVGVDLHGCLSWWKELWGCPPVYFTFMVIISLLL